MHSGCYSFFFLFNYKVTIFPDGIFSNYAGLAKLWAASLFQVAFAQHQAEVVKMEKFDNVCAEKISWSGNLFGEVFSLIFLIVVTILK